MSALTPEDLGSRAKLLVDKHAAYIKSFSNLWEVRIRPGQHTCPNEPTSATHPAAPEATVSRSRRYGGT